MSGSDHARPKSFRHGLLVHLILVPSWVGSPALLLAGLVGAGRPHGAGGIAAALIVGAGLSATRTLAQRMPLCLAVLCLGAKAPPGHERLVATASACLATFLAWLCKGGKADFQQRPALLEFLQRYRADYYARAELRGELGSIHGKQSCFAFHPHGVLCAGWTINGVYNPLFTKSAGRVHWLGDYALIHKNPSFRALAGATQSEDIRINSADKDTLKQLMALGENVAMVPGGFQDVVAYQFGKDCTVLRKRKGFIKYCLRYGYRLHPVYTFGESQTYWAFTGLRRLRMRISEHNIPMVAFFGWPLLPTLPRPQAQIVTYVGPCLELPLIPDPSEAEVDRWHGAYVDALKDLFNSRREEAGFPDAQLEIL